ncbi:MAG TPA: porin [Steroidobacteraceae bacterium]|nr:porin [Steroidobacteraceae bacterium]
MRLQVGLAGAAMALIPLSAALAQDAAPAITDAAAVLQRLEEAEQRIKVLERKLELQDEATTAATASAPVVRAQPNRWAIQSADGANSVRLRGVLHVDGRHFEGDGSPATANTWLLRRVRPIVEGTFAKYYDFRFTPDFGGGKTVVQDAYVTARFKPWAQVTVGKFKVPVGLERIQSANDLRFVERGFPTSLVPNRDIGVQLAGQISGGVVGYNVSYTNGVVDGGSSENNASPDVENDAKGDVSARLFFQPFLNSDRFGLRQLGFGIAGTYVDSTGSSTNTLLPSYKTPGQATFFSYRSATAGNNATFADGQRLRWSPQFYYYYSSFGLLGEYAVVSQDVRRVNGTVDRSDTLDHKAWQLQFSWLLTGEDESFGAVTPAASFELGKPGRGAWELVARVQELTIDSAAFAGGADSFANPATAARRARAAGIGVNWYLNPNVKWSVNYEQTRFDGGAATGDRPDEKAFLTRIGLAF